jgi:hypothetical protein
MFSLKGFHIRYLQNSSITDARVYTDCINLIKAHQAGCGYRGLLCPRHGYKSCPYLRLRPRQCHIQANSTRGQYAPATKNFVIYPKVKAFLMLKILTNLIKIKGPHANLEFTPLKRNIQGKNVPEYTIWHRLVGYKLLANRLILSVNSN